MSNRSRLHPLIGRVAFLVLVAVTLACPTAVHADDTDHRSCADWKERAGTVEKAVKVQAAHNRDYRRAMPWFYQHCRFLTEQELEARKSSDSTTFVCDTAKGRPVGLTPKFVREHRAPLRNVDVLTLWDEERRTHVVATNRKCASEDPVSLSWSDEPDPESEEAHEKWLTAKMALMAEKLKAPKPKPKG